VDYAKLKTKDAELRAAHPEWTDQQICNAINAETVEAEVDTIDACDVFEAIVPTERTALTTNQKENLRLILGMGVIRVSGANTRAALAGMFGAGTTTRESLIALQTRTTTWPQYHLGLAIVYPGHLENART